MCALDGAFIFFHATSVSTHLYDCLPRIYRFNLGIGRAFNEIFQSDFLENAERKLSNIKDDSSTCMNSINI